MYQTLNIHNTEKKNIQINFWNYPKEGGCNKEVVETDCGYVSVTQTDGFYVDNISADCEGTLQVDIYIGAKAGKYATELKDFADSDPPFKCLRIEAPV